MTSRLRWSGKLLTVPFSMRPPIEARFSDLEPRMNTNRHEWNAQHSCSFVSIRGSNIQHIESGRVRKIACLKTILTCRSILADGNQENRNRGCAISKCLTPVCLRMILKCRSRDASELGAIHFSCVDHTSMRNSQLRFARSRPATVKTAASL